MLDLFLGFLSSNEIMSSLCDVLVSKNYYKKPSVSINRETFCSMIKRD
jgi:hypothetical protein